MVEVYVQKQEIDFRGAIMALCGMCKKDDGRSIPKDAKDLTYCCPDCSENLPVNLYCRQCETLIDVEDIFFDAEGMEGEYFYGMPRCPECNDLLAVLVHEDNL